MSSSMKALGKMSLRVCLANLGSVYFSEMSLRVRQSCSKFSLSYRDASYVAKFSILSSFSISLKFPLRRQAI